MIKNGIFHMIKVVKKRFIDTNNTNLYVGTHNGIFHCDEVLAVAMLSILVERININVNVIRSRDINFLNENTDILVDVGGGKYDHHQKGGNGERSNGVKYASAGLIWNRYGNQIVSALLASPLGQEEISTISSVIDKEIIQKVDMEDNGQLVASHPFQFITSFLPKWNETADYDECFERCVNITRNILVETIKLYISLYLAKKEISSRLDDKKTHIENIAVLPSQNIPWVDIIIEHNNTNDNVVDFVVFPYPNGGYAIQCVPLSKEKPFSQRVPFPEEWAGETTNLPLISGIDSATFCHNGRFFARANNFEDIIEMGKIATKKYEMGK